MRPSEALRLHHQKILDIIISHHIKEAFVFGSVLHGTDKDDSDLDLLVTPTENTTLMDLGAIRYELKELLGIPVDVITPNALPKKFRDKVLKEAIPL